MLSLSLRIAAQAVADEPTLPERMLPSLDPILKQAVAQSPHMINRALDIEVAENDRIQARAGLLPTVGGYASYTQARDTRADLSGRLNVTKVAYNFSVSQPLFFWGERRNSAQMGEIRKLIAQGQYREGYRLLAQELRGKYLSLIAQKVSVERSRYFQKFAQEQLRNAEDKRAKNVISDVEMFQPRLTAERAGIDLERAEFEFATAKHAFARLAGVPMIKDDAIPDAVPPIGYAVDQYDQLLAGFLSLHEFPSYDAVSTRRQLEITELDYMNQKTRLRPKLSLTAGASQDEQSYTVNVAQKYRVNSLYAGVQVNWSIFDSFASQAAVRSALARRRQMENSYAELNDRLATQAQAQNKQIYFASRNMSINDRFLSSAEGNLRAKQEEFKRGIISEADVSLVQISVYDARVNAYNSRADYMIRIGEFLGTLDQDPVTANLASKK